jgi:hypothetical protein
MEKRQISRSETVILIKSKGQESLCVTLGGENKLPLWRRALLIIVVCAMFAMIVVVFLMGDPQQVEKFGRALGGFLGGFIGGP